MEDRLIRVRLSHACCTTESGVDLAISALAVHHLDNAAKPDLFRRVHTQLRSGGRFILADVVVPEDPEDAVTPIGPPHDKPSPLADQLGWLQQAGLQPTVRWQHKDLVVIAADV
jgi:tRNA (cmo5U34)-methyltransferase